MIRLSVFIAASSVLTYLSRSSLVHPRSHGFFRFFAWECILALIVINSIVWFRDPLSFHQLVSWFLLIASLVPLQHAACLLPTRGRPDRSRSGDPTLFAIERTSRLVTTGAFRFIRHPAYCSLLLLAWGSFFKAPTWSIVWLPAAATVLLVVTAKVEEAENLRFFGPDYLSYMKRTKMFIPFLF